MPRRKLSCTLPDDQTTLAILDECPLHLPKVAAVKKLPKQYTVRENIVDEDFLTSRVTFAQGKMLHALLLVCEAYDWKPPADGMFDVDASSLHKVTRKIARTWGKHITDSEKIKRVEGWDSGLIGLIRQLQDVTINLETLHRYKLSIGEADTDSPEHIGDLSVISEVVAADPKQDRSFSRIRFRVPEILIKDFFRTTQWGRVDVQALFSIKSEYAFYAYMFAAVRLIEKDHSKKVFFSKSYPISKWSRILHFEGMDMEEWRVKQNIFSRVTKYVLGATATTNRPLHVAFVKKENGYQMRIEIIDNRKDLLQLCKSLKLQKVSKMLTQKSSPSAVLLQQKGIEQLKSNAAEQGNRLAFRIAEEMRLAKEVHAHPRREEIYRKLRRFHPNEDPQALEQITNFELSYAIGEIEGIECRDFGIS